MHNFKTGEYHKYAYAIRETERRHGIPENLLAKVLCHTSEGYDARAISGAKHNRLGVFGIAKFTIAEATAFGVADRSDAYACIAAAGEALQRFHRDIHSWQGALLAFRWGESNYLNWERTGRGAPVPEEAREFVGRVMQ